MKTTTEQRAALRLWLNDPDHNIGATRTIELLDDIDEALAERDQWRDALAARPCANPRSVCPAGNAHHVDELRDCGKCDSCRARAAKGEGE